MLSMEMFRTWRSTWATKVLCRPASSAKASCDQPRSPLSRIKLIASNSRADGVRLGADDEREIKASESHFVTPLSQPRLSHNLLIPSLQHSGGAFMRRGFARVGSRSVQGIVGWRHARVAAGICLFLAGCATPVVPVESRMNGSSAADMRSSWAGRS